jgi:hypothetical protein
MKPAVSGAAFEIDAAAWHPDCSTVEFARLVWIALTLFQ